MTDLAAESGAKLTHLKKSASKLGDALHIIIEKQKKLQKKMAETKPMVCFYNAHVKPNTDLSK